MIRLTYAGKFWLAYTLFLALFAYAAPDIWVWIADSAPVMVN